MPKYRRVVVPGASYFFTVALARRGDSTLTDNITLLRHAWRLTASEHPVRCDAMVVLPDHLHAVWTLPPGDADYSLRWRKLKARFSHALGQHGVQSASQIAKRERGVWQRRFWEHMIRDEADFRAHVTYCWGNPVKHGLVAQAGEWPFSSIHRDIRAGRVEPEWAGTTPDGVFGE